jgi:hypothetical protein
MNRHERRRARSMKEFIPSGDGEREGTPQFEAEVERDANLALELEQHVRRAILPWLAKHPEVDWTCTAPALFRVAAVQIMAASPGTTPEDVGVMAGEVAKTVEKVADHVAEKVRSMTSPPDAEEPRVDKQVRLVLEQQTIELAKKLKVMVPAGVGYMLFLADYGANGNLAYVSTCNRQDAIRLMTEWLARQMAGSDHPRGSES